MGHVGQDVGETDDELSEIDDNEADMMSDESHETDEWWLRNDDELDEISDFQGWRLIEADWWLTNYNCDFEYNLFVGIFSNWIITG